MDNLIQDLRYGVRSLLRQRAFALAALLCLALGIGLNASIYTVVNGVLLRPLPIRDAERVVSVQWYNDARGVDDGGLAAGDVEDLRASGMFETVATVMPRGVTLTGTELSERVAAASITPNLLPLLGQAPALGRNFRDDEGAEPGFEQVVLLSHALWQRHFGGDTNVLDRTIQINGRSLTVIGVMPAGFGFPEREDVWLPYAARDPQERVTSALWTFARLQPGVSVGGAGERARELGERMLTLRQDPGPGWYLQLDSYRNSIVDAGARRALWMLLGAVSFVLLIACANVANLMLARAADRTRELAVRSAMGGSASRLLRQLLTESFLLAAVGGALGLLLALWFVDATVRTIPEQLVYWMEFTMDRRVLGYTVAITIGTVLLFGLLPAVQAVRADQHGSLRDSGRNGDSRERARLRAVLVSAEIALSLTLLFGAQAMIRSFLRLQAADPGFATENLLSFRGTLVGDRYDVPVARAEFWQTAAERVAAVPGVTASAFTSALPADDGGGAVPAWTMPTSAPPTDAPLVSLVVATSGLPATLGVPVLAGRDFTSGEARDSTRRVALLGATAARRFFPDGALGQTLRVGQAGVEYTVVGVIADLQYEEFGEETEESALQVYVTPAQYAWRNMAAVVRHETAPGATTEAVRGALRTLDAGFAPYDILGYDDRLYTAQWEAALFGRMFGSFGALAMLLAVAGIYGVMAYTVAQRRREMGVRLALGASPRRITTLILRRGGVMVGSGLAIGLLGAAAVEPLLRSQLYGAQPVDRLWYLWLPLVLGGSALLACWLPARRAARTDPQHALRSD